MAMSEEERKEHKTMLAEAFAEGLALFRSQAEEEAAKNQPPVDDKGKKGGNDDDGFSFAGFLLGR